MTEPYAKDSPDAAAADWLLRQQQVPDDPALDAELQQWLQQDPSHWRSWQRAQQVWQLTASLTPLPRTNKPRQRRWRYPSALAASVLLSTVIGHSLLHKHPQYRSDKSVVSGVAYWYAAVCAAQAGWTVAFAQDVVWLSMCFMLLILGCLCALCHSVVRVDEPASEAWSVAWRYTCFRAPFLMHLGWITAATFVNFNACVVKYAAADTELQLIVAIATIALLLLPGLVNAATTPLSGTADPLYSLVLVWAFFGVHKELSKPELEGHLKTWVTPLVQHALAGVAALMAGGLLVVVLARLAVKLYRRMGAGNDTSAPVYPRFEERSDSKPAANGL